MIKRHKPLLSSSLKERQASEACVDGDCIVRILDNDKAIYIPVYKLKIGDRIFCIGNDFELVDSISVSIQSRLYFEHQMGVITVSKSHKFITNNLKSRRADTYRIGQTFVTDSGKESKILNVIELDPFLVYDIHISGLTGLYFAEGIVNGNL